MSDIITEVKWGLILLEDIITEVKWGLILLEDIMTEVKWGLILLEDNCICCFTVGVLSLWKSK